MLPLSLFPVREVLHTTLMLGLGASQPAAQNTFSSSWTWAALIGVIGIAVTVGISVIQSRKRRIERQAEELKPVHELLCAALLLLDDLERTEATKADLAGLLEKRSRIDHAAETWPKIPLAEITTLITAYEATAFPDNSRRTRPRRDQVGELLERSRKQWVAIAALRTAIKTAKREIERLRNR